MRHHTDKPEIKKIPPLTVLTRHTIGKCPDTFLPVPSRQIVKILFHRPEVRDAPGIHIALHVIFDCRYPFQLCLETNALDYFGRHRAIVYEQRMPFAIFLTSLHPVEPQIITPRHELFHLHRHQHPPWHTRPDTAMFFFPENVPESHPQLHLPLFSERMYQGKTNGILFRDSRLVAFASQVHHKPFPFFHRPVFRSYLSECLGKAGFIEQRDTFITFISGRHTP